MLRRLQDHVLGAADFELGGRRLLALVILGLVDSDFLDIFASGEKEKLLDFVNPLRLQREA